MNTPLLTHRPRHPAPPAAPPAATRPSAEPSQVSALPPGPAAFLARVQERGAYPTPEQADRAARVVLALLGAHLVGRARAALAVGLPSDYALILINPLQAAEPLSAHRFVRAAAAWIEDATEHSAEHDVKAVLSVLADTARQGLVQQILLQLPRSYEDLFLRP